MTIHVRLFAALRELAGGAVVVSDCGEMLEVQAISVTSANGSHRRIEMPARATIKRSLGGRYGEAVSER